MDFHNITDFLTIDNPYVLHTLFAIISLALGLFGMVLGQRAATNGKLCIILGLAIGIGTMFLISTPYAFLAPGWCVVFMFCFLASSQVLKLANVTAGKPAADAPPAPKPKG